jgi:hypothetical protein
MRRVSASDYDELWVESKKVCSPTLGLAGEGFSRIQGRHFVGRGEMLYRSDRNRGPPTSEPFNRTAQSHCD